MGLYSVNRLMQETRRLAVEYHRLTGQVLPVSSQLAQYYVVQLLDFAEPPLSEPGVEVVGSGNFEGLKAQIKSRVQFQKESSGNPRIGHINPQGAWNAVLLVLLNQEYYPREIILADKTTLLSDNGSSENPKLQKKGAMSVAKFRRLGQVIWDNTLSVKEKIQL